MDEFNRGVYDYVIATDEAHGSGILDNTCHVTACLYPSLYAHTYAQPGGHYFEHITLTTKQLCQQNEENKSKLFQAAVYAVTH